MFLKIDTYNFGLECAGERKAGKLTAMKLKVFRTVLTSDLENQKKLSREFWEAWSHQGEIVKLKVISFGKGKTCGRRKSNC